MQLHSRKSQSTEDIHAIQQHCIQCQACVRQCAFLARYGTPWHCAQQFLQAQNNPSFECSLCGLCDAVCPVNISPRAMFAAMRRLAVAGGTGFYPQHRPVLAYERWGSSWPFSWYGLAGHGDTVFFPGCTLSGTHPGTVRRVFTHLRQSFAVTGIVLSCCGKPSYSLGRPEQAFGVFDTIQNALYQRGIRRVLTACPSCHNMFTACGHKLEALSVYEVLAGHAPKKRYGTDQQVTIHDPCAGRYEKKMQEAVRTLVRRLGLSIEEMPHHGETTLCCGEGGTVAPVAPHFAQAWTTKRLQEARGRLMITSCAGCVNFLRPHVPTAHILSLLYPDSQKGQIKQASPPAIQKPLQSPWTWLGRLWLIRRLKNMQNQGTKKVQA